MQDEKQRGALPGYRPAMPAFQTEKVLFAPLRLSVKPFGRPSIPPRLCRRFCLYGRGSPSPSPTAGQPAGNNAARDHMPRPRAEPHRPGPSGRVSDPPLL